MRPPLLPLKQQQQHWRCSREAVPGAALPQPCVTNPSRMQNSGATRMRKGVPSHEWGQVLGWTTHTSSRHCSQPPIDHHISAHKCHQIYRRMQSRADTRPAQTRLLALEDKEATCQLLRLPLNRQASSWRSGVQSLPQIQTSLMCAGVSCVGDCGPCCACRPGLL